MREMVHIALASNRRYLPGLRATVVSLVRAASEPQRILFHIFSDGLADDDKRSLVALIGEFGYFEPIDFRDSSEALALLNQSFKPYNGSYTPFLRLVFPDLFPELKWILWTDVDVLWFRDPIELWNERAESASVVWSRDIPSTRKAAYKQLQKWKLSTDCERYGCSGVVLMNLRRMRETNFVSRASDFVSRYGSPLFADQDLLNVLCENDAKLVDDRWDLLYPIKSIDDGVVVHFNGIGPKFNDVRYTGWSPLYEIWFRYVAQIVNRRGEVAVCGVCKRIYFSCLAFIYPLHRVIAFLTDPIHPWVSDFIQRNLLFAWLRTKRLWRT